MNDIKQITAIDARLKALAEERRGILSMPAEQAREAIFESPHGVALVHSIREEDFYFLVQEIGGEDALELLGLASARQWEFLLDMDMWEKDRISLATWTRWLNLLMRADPKRLVRWISEEHIEEIEYYLFRNLQVVFREHDEDPSDFGEGFHTYDDVVYVRFDDTLYDPEKDAEALAERDAFLEAFLSRLAADDHGVYHNMLLESRCVIPAEQEEEAYRLRNVRMAEKGFHPFDEAIGIYQGLPLERLQGAHPEAPSKRLPSGGAPPPLYPVSLLEPESLLGRSLAQMEAQGDIDALQSEFAGLCNRIISADQQNIQEREALRPVVKKACGYVGIGLEALAGGPDVPPEQAASLILAHPLEMIFRVGYGRALDLKWRAEKWRRESWAEARGLPLSFWGEAWLGVIGGLLIRRPLFFDNYRSGVLYREFHAMADIEAAERVLAQVIAVDELFGLMGDIPIPSERTMVTWERLMLSLWARHAVGREDIGLVLPKEVFRDFYETLWEGHLPTRRISDAAKERFLEWLAGAARLEVYALSRKFRETFEALFAAVEEEYQAVSGDDLDPRHVHFFMLS